MVSHWTGYSITKTDLRKFQGNISTRRAPPISQRVQDDLQQVFGRWTEELAGYYRKNWIRAVHENATMNENVQEAAIWTAYFDNFDPYRDEISHPKTRG
ncbi:hypothetical protein ON010_g6991 [Phytophthora cinnamomi]|nr:hypothetical protein ON010_g6991 [Phytophthora cinnamomi]